jgi:glycosyltransferase involved in cell wall biosynthesis
MASMISVLILTFNEEKDLPGCLRSVSWCDDIHILDSYSTDGTLELARAAGARVRQRTFDGYASQRNAALEECDFRHEWILILDADERLPERSSDVLQQLVRDAPPELGGFRLRRRDHLGGRWLKHAQITPYYVRLVRRGSASYHREVNEVITVRGDILDAGVSFDHHPFSKGIAHWIRKHERYACMEADRIMEERKGQHAFSVVKALTARDPGVRRYHQKGLFYRMPFRPLLKWMYMMFVRGAFLDGQAGVTYANLQAIYEYFIVLRTREINGKG